MGWNLVWALYDALFSHSCVVILSRVKYVNTTETETIQYLFIVRNALCPCNLEILLIRIFSKTQEVSCHVFTPDHGVSFRLFVQDNVKDDANTCEDVVERDVGGYTTQKVLSRTLNVKLLDAQRSKTKQRQRQQQRYCTTVHSGSFQEVEHEHTQAFFDKVKESETDKLHENRCQESKFLFPR